MFVHKETIHRVVLRKSHVSDSLAVATVVVQAAFDCRAPALLIPLARRAPRATDPPDTSAHALWDGVSVTAAGTVLGGGSQGRKDVALRVGRQTWTLAVFGPRRWIPGPSGGLLPSAPLPFESLPLSYEHASGGSFEMPPRIEWSDSLVRSAADRPEPAGFAPCPHLEGLRFPASGVNGPALPGRSLAGWLAGLPALWARIPHHAHGRLIAPRIEAGTEIVLSGLGGARIGFSMPDLRLTASLLAGSPRAPRSARPMRVALRALHIDADEGVVLFTFGATATYASNAPPSWVRVTAPDNHPSPFTSGGARTS